MRWSMILVVTALAGCGGSKSAAECMEAMATVICPPGTRPEAASEGEDQFSAGGEARVTTQTYTVQSSGGSRTKCDYVCIPYCDCGISSIGGDGSVICSPCN